LALRFRLGPRGPTIETEAEVTWMTREEDLAPGMHYCEIGMRFLDLSDSEAFEIAEFVERAPSYWPEEQETDIPPWLAPPQRAH
jgi:hypothetical protein